MVKIYEEPLEIELKGNDLFVNRKKHSVNIRDMNEMRDVLILPSKEKSNLYFMYRSVYQLGGIRYDITFLPKKIIEGEYVKTYGHYHPKAKDGIEYPEVYQVLHGNALFVLQKKNQEKFDVLVIRAAEKEVVLFPPGYGHVSINPDINEDLVLGNIVSSHFESDYSDYKKQHGAAYYYTIDGLIKNGRYAINSFEKLKPSELNKAYGFEAGDLLGEFYKCHKKFEFLDKPGVLFK